MSLLLSIFLLSLIKENKDAGEQLRLEQLAQGKTGCGTHIMRMQSLLQLHSLYLVPLLKFSISSSQVILIFTFYFCNFQNTITWVILRQYQDQRNKSSDHMIIEDPLLLKSKPLWFQDCYEHLAQGKPNSYSLKKVGRQSRSFYTVAIMDLLQSVSWSSV